VSYEKITGTEFGAFTIGPSILLAF